MLIWDLNLNSFVKQKSVSPTRLNKYASSIVLEAHLHVLEKNNTFLLQQGGKKTRVRRHAKETLGMILNRNLALSLAI